MRRCFLLDLSLPFLAFPLPLHCLSLPFHCLFTAFPCLSTASSLPFLAFPLPLHCLFLPLHCLFTAFPCLSTASLLPFLIFHCRFMQWFLGARSGRGSPPRRSAAAASASSIPTAVSPARCAVAATMSCSHAGGPGARGGHARIARSRSCVLVATDLCVRVVHSKEPALIQAFAAVPTCYRFCFFKSAHICSTVRHANWGHRCRVRQTLVSH